MPRNVIVAQSGGPSPVINNSLRGVIDACQAHPDDFGTIYAGWHGIEGVLKEELLDLSAQDAREIELLSTTPAAGAIGTCRYKLKDDQQIAMSIIQGERPRLPFSERWLDRRVPRVDKTIKGLVRAGSVYSYPILKEMSDGMVSQWEHTLFVTEKGCKILTY